MTHTHTKKILDLARKKIQNSPFCPSITKWTRRGKRKKIEKKDNFMLVFYNRNCKTTQLQLLVVNESLTKKPKSAISDGMNG